MAAAAANAIAILIIYPPKTAQPPMQFMAFWFHERTEPMENQLFGSAINDLAVKSGNLEASSGERAGTCARVFPEIAAICKVEIFNLRGNRSGRANFDSRSADPSC
jgi:hypothetical protein